MQFLEDDIDTYTVCLGYFYVIYVMMKEFVKALEFESFLLTSDMCVFINYM